MTEYHDQFVERIDAWRYPALAVLRSPVPPSTVARAVARDLAAAWTPEGGIARLLEQAEFALAATSLEALGEDPGMDKDRLDLLRARLAKAQHEAQEEVECRRRKLVARCDRNAIPIPADLLIATRATDDLGKVGAKLDSVDLTIREIEKTIAEELRLQLDSVRSSLAPHRSDHVAELMTAGEFLLARQALTAHDDQPLIPLHVREKRWSWPSLSLRQVLHYFDTPADRPAGMPLFVPGDDDPCGQALVAALRQLEERSENAITAYVTAVQNLIADVDVAPRINNSDGVRTTHLLIPDDPRLPKLDFVGRNPVLFVVGDANTDTAFRLALRMSEPSGVPGIDIASVLALLAKDEDGRVRSKEARRISFLRSLCVNLELDHVDPAALPVAAPELLRSRLWWLLHLVGQPASPVVLDQLTELSGGHARPLLAIIRAANLRQEFDVDALRTEEGFDDLVLAAVRADLPDPAFVALMTLVYFGTTSEEELRLGIVHLLKELDSPVAVDSIVDIEASLETLRQKGYLPGWRPDNDDLTLCGCGVLRSLARTQRADEEALRTLKRLLGQHGSDVASVAVDALHRRALTDLIHLWADDKQARSGDPRADVAANREVRRNFQDWLEPDQSLDLDAECHTVWRKARDRHRRVDVIFNGNTNLVATGARLALRLSLENLVNNSIQAAAKALADDDRFGTVEFTMLAEDGGSRAVIDILDSGHGVVEAVRSSLEHGLVPPSTEHSGNGAGLAAAKHWIEALGGTLTLLPEPAPRLGGAHFRIVLPARVVQSGG
ncbi:ATP-binding protein [Amycolatopsis sp. NPDC003731]